MDKERDVRECACCGKETERQEMLYTRDCHGITLRLVCFDCYKKVMKKG